ncbi:MAG: sigma 54-interacting transcriptional regulator [Polyangiaceae bacterium]|nr:sigma 54-interacting transcriptional regulator [Polyangiaceae bacterium]
MAGASVESVRKGGVGLALLYAQDFETVAPAFPFMADRVVLGRDPDAGVCIAQRAISRHHAHFLRRTDADSTVWTVEDARSRNGTYVGARRIDAPTPLLHGTILRTGDAIFMFVERDIAQFALDHIDGTRLSSGGAASPPADRPAGRWQVARVAEALARVARSPIAVAIQGETGTGKEMFAEYLHRASGRKGPLRALNCSAIPGALLESELFGYRRGAFSGADRDKIGLVQSADGGTLFLDEIGDMPLDAQAKLLRVLQSREVLPLGAVQPERVDIRVACATHRDLRSAVDAGRFRGDLYARLAELTVTLPPLRDRKEDIYLLTRLFMKKHGAGNHFPSLGFMQALLTYDFPFNVRELESLVKRAVAFCESGTLEARHLPENLRPATVAPAPDQPLEQRPSEQELSRLLKLHQGNVAAVGRTLQKAPAQVHRWMRRYGLDPATFRPKA